MAKRQRARQGRRVVPVELSPEAEDVLLRAGVLEEWDADDRLEVGRAVERLLETLAMADRHA
jgi:hypothetical protein